MTALLLEQAISWPGAEGEPFDSAIGARGRFTLDDAIVGVWEDLAVRAVARCPVCAGPMRRREIAEDRAVGSCGRCGARLS
jgi:hypothetical protein